MCTDWESRHNHQYCHRHQFWNHHDHHPCIEKSQYVSEWWMGCSPIRGKAGNTKGRNGEHRCKNNLKSTDANLATQKLHQIRQHNVSCFPIVLLSPLRLRVKEACLPVYSDHEKITEFCWKPWLKVSTLFGAIYHYQRITVWKSHFSRYFITFSNNNNVAMMFNIGLILALNYLLL